jgi:hypothetical protein
MALALGACTLDRESFNEIYPENFFLNEEDVNKALSGLYYSSFRLGYSEDGFYGVDQYSYAIVSDFAAGTMESRNTGTAASSYPSYYLHSWDASMPDCFARTFTERMYSRYNHLTSVLETIKRIQEAPITAELKAKATAEAKCIYAWIGFILYDLFGPVPLVTEEALAKPNEKVLIPRLSDAEYTAIMHQYLDDAIAELPLRQDNDWGRVSKGLALTLKLKFYMIDKNFVEAEKVARELIGYRGETYDLLPDYGQVFDSQHLKNREIIHAIPYGLLAGMANRTVLQFYPVRYDNNHQCWFTFGMDKTFYGTFESGDDRRSYVVTSYTSITGEQNDDTHGFLTSAYPIIKVDDKSYTGGDYAAVDLVIYRFADVMLSLAECINENSSSPTPEAIDLVNEIRRRVNLPNLTNNETDTQAAFRRAILSERLHEFMAEGLARQDKIRNGVFVSDSKAQYPNSQSADHKARFPIPARYILESEGVVKQNDGYTN